MAAGYTEYYGAGLYNNYDDDYDNNVDYRKFIWFLCIIKELRN